MPLEGFNIQELQTKIAEQEAGWIAGETPFTRMSSVKRAHLLGYVPGPGERTLAERERIAKANLVTFLAAVEAVSYPKSFDLRNVNGKQFITDIRDQGSCGSCVAFGTAAVVEGTFRYQSKTYTEKPNEFDLSEAHLFYCYARSEGKNCMSGWQPGAALNAFRDKGVADEASFAYFAGDQDCKLPYPERQDHLTKITGWHTIYSVADMKEWLSTKGPLVACFTVYDDFFYYFGGIYRHLHGHEAGGHCVCVVGYDDDKEYWICKNSWGNLFGEVGYFKIAYGECGIDSSMDAVEGIIASGWYRCHVDAAGPAEDGKIYISLLGRGFNAWFYADPIIAQNALPVALDALVNKKEASVALTNIMPYSEIQRIYLQ
jgi:hypothetical protein